MRFYLTIIFVLVLCLASKLYAVTVPNESWMGTYVGSQKIGSVCSRIDRAEINGIHGYRLENFLNNSMKLMGTDMAQQISSVVFVDSSYFPIKENFSITSAGKTTSVEALYEKDFVNCITNADNRESCKRIPIPDGAKSCIRLYFWVCGI